jgi:hypothetical protein
MRDARCEIAAKFFRATGLFPRDKNIFRPHELPVDSEDTDAAPVNHPILVNNSDQTLFNSVSFRRSLLLRPVQSLNLQPNTHGATAMKITSSLYRKFVWANQKKENHTGH